MKWLDTNQIEVTPPKRPKKCTGTRFATIMGLNPWSTPFEAWCAITRTYEEPFEDTIYTIAGKEIEPKQAEYMKKSYGMDIITPTDIYGEDYFK
jgi:predicted phage-related endonuclease